MKNSARAYVEKQYIHDDAHEHMLMDRYSVFADIDIAMRSGDAGTVWEVLSSIRSNIREVNRRYTPEEENQYQTFARLISVNTILEVGCHRSGVHPLLVHSIGRRFDKAIARCSVEQEMVLMKEMVEDYCQLIRNARVEHYGEFSDQVIRILLSNLASPPSLEELSEQLYVSTATISRRFKKETGQTIPEFINHFRIRVAKMYMQEGGMTLSEIAQMLGFSDASHYSKVFRRYEGIRPTEYRNIFHSK